MLFDNDEFSDDDELWGDDKYPVVWFDLFIRMNCCAMATRQRPRVFRSTDHACKTMTHLLVSLLRNL